MDRYFTKTFFRFFIAFLVIIGIAFGIMLITSSQFAPQTQVAQPSQ